MVYHAIIGLVFSVLCSGRNATLRLFSLAGNAQGTTYTITYYASDSLVTQKHVDHLLARIDSSLSIYKPYSMISRFNDTREGMAVDTLFQSVVRRSLEVSRATRGAFDITVYPLVDAWGFGRSKMASLPDSAVIRSILPCIGAGNISIQNGFLKKAKPCVRIDVNGIAQGYSVDLLAGLLEARGIGNYLVELGGELRIKGRKQSSGEARIIGIESPVASAFEVAPLQQLVRVEEGALTTSGSYRKWYESNGQKISHLIDPRSGYPVQNELISVTVFARDACTADGLDNAFMVMGLKRTLTFLSRQKGVEAYFIYRKKNGSIGDTATAGFRSMMVGSKAKTTAIASN